ncbi:MAG: tetratricopeptide repeat protein [Longimicrobiales bacterium]
MITVQLLGGASLRYGDSALTGPPAQRHRVALLALLVASWPQPVSRDRAMALLWPERGEASARRLLNLAVHVLRSALGGTAITSAGDGLLYNPTGSSCDLHELRAAIAAHQSEHIVRLYGGAFLDGFHLEGSTEFDYWLDARRAELAHAYVGALRVLAQQQQECGDVHNWVGTCRRLTAAEPHSGAHAIELMRALDAAGDRAGALQHANDYAQRVRVDLELEPDPAVLALAQQLRSGAPGARTSGPAPVASIAVLPFLTLGADGEDDGFADGITEDVIAQLSKIRALKVISRTSVMAFKRRPHSVKEMGARLGVAALLDGSVRRAGERVRIVATLVDVASERQLWSDTYDRELTDIFAIQTDVALHIAGALKAELTRDEHARVARQPTRDIRAYERFLEGRQWLSRYSPSALARAIEYFSRAIEYDPGYALAHASLALAHLELVEDGAMHPEPAYRRAAAALTTALELDPELGAAHCSMGHLQAVSAYDWPAAEAAFKRAIELNPSGADAYALYGRLCAALERYDEAIALQQRARELDPLAHRVDLATTLLRAGRYDQAIAYAANAVELDADHDRARATLGWAYFLSGRTGAGLAELERAVASSKGNQMWLAQLAEAYALAGDPARARAILQELEAKAKSVYVSPYHFAYVYTGLGEAERALDWLERAVEERTGPAYSISGSFLLAPLQRHPRFQALLRRMNIV